ncbi:MAG: signal peptidase II [Rhizobiaceae bacterium]
MKLTFPKMAVLVAVFIAADQLIKWLVETRLEFQALVEVLPFLGLYRTWNEGIAFSWLWGMDERFLVIMTTAIILFVLWLARQTAPENWLARLGFSMIIGGAIGNLIDRAYYGHVVDYVLFHTPTWSFAVFNLADALISVGAAFIILAEFLDWRASRQVKSAE